jgi:pyruvate formate lyase activating enzyme
LAGALEIIGRPMDLDDVIEEVLRDKPFYDSSGGGITLSGGEPFMQSEFTMALLKKSKKAGLHVCIETSGFARQQLIKESMEYVDIYLFDYKATDPQKHTDFTGVSNEVIIANLQFLLENQARVILRCPLIEGVNDSPGHLEGIASLYRQYQHLAGLEVMAYHNMGKDKGIRVGIDKEKMLEQPLTPEAVKSGWIDKLKSLGCSIAKIG